MRQHSDIYHECKVDDDLSMDEGKLPMIRYSSEVNSGLDIRDHLNPSYDRIDREEYQPLLCLVCKTNKCNVIVYPCRHFNFCLECTQAMIEKNSKCPVCRVDIQFTIYLS